MLTNNWKSENSDNRLIFEEVDKFDHVVESCVVGMRKPEPGIYQLTLDTLGVRAEEAVFLDDLGHNLKELFTKYVYFIDSFIVKVQPLNVIFDERYCEESPRQLKRWVSPRCWSRMWSLLWLSSSLWSVWTWESLLEHQESGEAWRLTRRN